jgi:tetratricopeptide (TPR) repeat protein
MGVVFIAEQQEPIRRKVALKVLKPGMDTRPVIARFEAERQALAIMDHPNIATVLDGGQTATARPYFVMELVRGVPITDYCDQGQLTPRERLELFLHVCQAVQHAHQKGIIHRDLKPSNVLVTLHDETPLVKVIDFGIAKALGQQLTDKTLFTGFAQMIGTPLYMSPEQAALSNVDVDTRSDIYSLGVLLYELLTGTTPFEKERFKEVGYDEIRRIIREEEPPKPSTRISTLGQAASTASANRRSDPRKLSQLCRGELDWIVMKALEKDRTRRYESASALAADVERYLKDEPVLACPPSAWYRFRKFARRNKGALATAALLGVILVLALVGGPVATALVWQQWTRAEEAGGREKEQRQKAEDERGRAQKKGVEAEQAAEVAQTVLQFFVSDILGAAELDRSGGRAVTVAEVLVEAERHIETAFRDQPLLEAAVRHAMGTTYFRLGQFGPAERHLARAREVRARILGTEHLDTLIATRNLAVVFCYQGRQGEALKLTEQTLASRRRLLGKEHKDTLTSMTDLAVILHEQGKRAEARKLLEETITLQKRVLGAEHRTTLASIDELATMLYVQGKKKEARELQEEVLALAKRFLGPEHRDTITMMSNLAVSLWREGRLDEALKLHEDALKLRSRLLGPNHPDTLQAMVNLASSLEEQGKTEDARKLLDEALPRQERILGKEHPDTLNSRHVLANLLEDHGRFEEARGMLVETLALQTRILGAVHPQTIYSMRDLATVLKAQGKFGEARRLGEETRVLATRTLGAEHPDTLRVTNNLAILLWVQGEREQARKLLAQNLAVRKRTLGPEHPDTLRSMSTLADKLWGLGQLAEARKLLEACLPVQTRRLGKEHPDTLDSLTNLANVLNGEGKAEEARKLHDEVLAVRRRKLGPKHPKTLRAMHNVATDLATHGKLTEGRKLHQETLALFKSVCGPEHPDTLESMFCVATALLLEDKLEESWKLFEETIALQTRVFGAGHHKTLGSMNNLVILLVKLAERFDGDKRYQEAEQAFRRTLALLVQLEISYRKSPKHLNALVSCQARLALFLVSCPDLKFRNVEEAMALARKAVERLPGYRDGWIVLGMAQYRAGDWKAAISTLEGARKRFKSNNPADWLILAMAHWRLGEKDKARHWFDQAEEWMRKNGRQYRDLQSLRAEAAELLGIKEEPAPKEQSK